MSNRKEGRKWRENTNQKAPDGFSRLEVFEKAATKKDDHNHPNSLQQQQQHIPNSLAAGKELFRKESIMKCNFIIGKRMM